VGKSPLQVIDQVLDSSPVLLFDERHAPKTTGLADVATGFRDGDRPLAFVDPLVNLLAALCEQTSKVFGLAVIRRRSSRGTAVIDSRGGPVRGQRRPGLAVTDVGRPRAVLSDGPFRPRGIRRLYVAAIRMCGSARVACATLAGRSGEGHFVSLSRRFGV
jgi:hypothetical protein